ncbi:MAG: hypothetical protein WBI18_07635 [Candidatus Saccharicenans sp.]
MINREQRGFIFFKPEIIYFPVYFSEKFPTNNSSDAALVAPFFSNPSEALKFLAHHCPAFNSFFQPIPPS